MVDRLEYFAFFRKSTSLYRAYNVKDTIMLVDMADFFIKQNKKSLPTFSVSRLNIKIKRCHRLFSLRLLCLNSLCSRCFSCLSS